MAVFDYDESFQQAEYYELLNVLMERWETEIVEFKEAKGGYSEDKIGQYFSAISNEANLKKPTIRMVCVRRQRGTHEASCWNIF